jgi:glycosyltransferase involved in cell wall biosynthesis
MAEAIAYGAGLAAWQHRLAAQVDAFITPSQFAHARLQQLGAPLGATFVVPHVVRAFAEAPPITLGQHALLASRLVPEKGIEVAVQACREAGLPLVVAGDGPERARLEPRVTPGEVTFTGRLEPRELSRLRREAAVALMPSLSAETFGLAAAEAMAAGVPAAASAIGGLPELVPGEWLAPPGDAPALAAAIRRATADPAAGRRALERARAVCAPEHVAPALADVYARAAQSVTAGRPPVPR